MSCVGETSSDVYDKPTKVSIKHMFAHFGICQKATIPTAVYIYAL